MESARSETKQGPDKRRVTVAEAADILGITAEAVRTRIKRGKLTSIKEPPDRTGTVYVVLEADQTGPNIDPTPQGQDQTPDQTQLVEALREQVAYLQGVIATRDQELAVRAEEIRRRDTALEREQQLAAFFAERLGELEAPREAREAPETVEEEPEAPAQQPRPATGRAQEATKAAEMIDEEPEQQVEPKTEDAGPQTGEQHQEPVEEPRDAQEPETPETDIPSGEVQQGHPDDTPSEEQEEDGSPDTVEGAEARETDKTAFEANREHLRRERDEFERRIEERRAAAEATRRQRPWWRRFLGQ